MGRRGPLVWVRQERGTPGVWAAAAQVAAMCTSSPAQHRGQPRRAPAACGNGLLVSERGSRSTLWPVSRPPGEATAWGPAQLQTVPKAAGPDPARKVQTVCAPAPDAGSGRPQPVGAGLRLIADSAWYGVAPGQVRSGLQRPSALHSTAHPAAVQPCSHAVMPRGERPPGRALRAVNNARATSVPPPPLWAAVAMLPRGISPRGRRAPRCRRSRA